MSSFARSTATVTVFTAAGLFLGFWSHMLIAARFGVGADMDAYLAATTLPSLIALILTTTLAATFLPVFTEWHGKDPEESWRIAGAFTSLTGLACLLAGLAILPIAHPVIRLIAPGLDPDAAARAASLLRWLMPVILFTAVNQILSGICYARGRFLPPMLIRVLSPLLLIAGVLALGDALGVRSLVLASVSAQAAQTAILLLALRGGGDLRAAMSPDWNHPGVRRILRLSAPLMLGMCVYKLGPVYERWLASGMGEGSISTLGYATRLIQVLQPVLVSGVAISGFALMAGIVPRGDATALRAALSRSGGALLFAGVPTAALLFGFAGPVIGLLFERGAFSPEDTGAVSRLFAIYAIGLPLGAVGTIIAQTFFAFQSTRAPIVSGMLDIALFVVLGSLLAPRLGLMALPAAHVISHHATTLWLAGRLHRETGFPVLPLFLRPFVQSAAASLAALGLGLLLERAHGAFFPSSYAASVACMALGSLAYPLIQHFAFRSPETARLLRILRRGKGKEASP